MNYGGGISKMLQKRKVVVSCLIAAFLGGCAANIHETHYFATINRATNEPVNFFRITVNGNVEMLNARFVSGYYDERAVDLFFNEAKAKDFGPIFGRLACDPAKPDDCKAKANDAYKVIPVGNAGSDQGAFVMILSTDATAITDTIGGLAENEAVLNSALYLATRGDRRELQQLVANKTILGKQRKAVIDELTRLFATMESTTSSAALEQGHLAVLQTLASSLAPSSSPQFKDFTEAKAWFAALPRGAQP
jgi:hypothetical protein